MFNGKYFDWNQKRIKGIVDFYGYKFFYTKKVLDLGCGHADMSGVLYRLGSEITAVDARQEHLKIVIKKFPGIKTVQANLDNQWPFQNQKFDLVLDLGLLCHLASFKEHLKTVCASASQLVLETAVCDSNDPEKCIKIEESKNSYDLAYGGVGCRPSPAAIEKILLECGMTFKRITNSRYNSGEYTYDWIPQNNDSTSLEKRAIWFAVKENDTPTRVSIPNILSDMIGAMNLDISGGVFIRTTASPKPPMSAGLNVVPNLRMGPQILPQKVAHDLPVNSAHLFGRIHSNPTSLNSEIRNTSKEFALIASDKYQTTNTYPNSGVILPKSFSSRMWLKKIAPLFPNIKVNRSSIFMPNFSKSGDNKFDVAMCHIDDIIKCDRLWIDEWAGPLLNSHIGILQDCKTIITPSLVNIEEIRKHLPNANIIRAFKPWPLVKTSPVSHNHFLYFEKDVVITKILYDAWEEKFGKLLVVGASMPVPAHISFISDCLEYEKLVGLMMGAKAIIDISNNNYYMSGILDLAKTLHVPIITNNLSDTSYATIISQDKAIGPLPQSVNIKVALNKFFNQASMNKEVIENHNDTVYHAMNKLLGAQ
jgi:SAM-dependent methyltransferase